MSLVQSRWLALRALLAGAALVSSFVSRPAWAQKAEEEAQAEKAEGAAEAEEEEEEEEEAPEALEGAAKADVEAAGSTKATLEPPQPSISKNVPAEEASTLADDFTEQKNGFVGPQPESTLEWHGGLELDVGYSQYGFDAESLHKEDYYAFGGRFVAGPTVRYTFGADDRYFLAARGELVAWVVDSNSYKINVDDVYGQVGQTGLWDFKVGRFRTWRVYHKGLGFDLYAIEDLGACVKNPCDPATGNFGPYVYEVSYIYNREQAGHAAFHLYPTPWSGIELAAVYGKAGPSNQVGGRGAAVVHFDPLRVSAAAEYRNARSAEEIAGIDINNNPIECPKCGASEQYGFGGGAELTLRPVEVGVNAAQGHYKGYSVKDGSQDPKGSGTITSLGGYAELDLGRLAFQKSLIFGFGLNRTERLDDLQNFEQHYQGAAYVVYPLGFNSASIKLVLSHARLNTETVQSDLVVASGSDMNSGRVRLTYPF